MATVAELDPEVTKRIRMLVDNIERVIFGKRDVVELCVTGLLARGHVLIEDIPGIGKTTLAHALAHSIDCEFRRIQFTSDMLPSDVLGVSVLDPRTNVFEFRKGPVFAGIVLADEINRTPPKSQSALLEAMSEYQVSVDGVTYPLPQPFMVLATQNPIEYEGTYILPESQLDRFMLRIEIGYPPHADELHIMRRSNPKRVLDALEPVLTVDEVIVLQEQVCEVHVDESLARHMLDLVSATRDNAYFELGASPRASTSFYQACQARALVQGRGYVTPDDVKALAVPTLSHRVIVKAREGSPAASSRARAGAVEDLLQRLPMPL
jgi:MoxR-like ATPase